MKKICVSCVVVVLSVATLFGGKLLGSKQENVPPVTLEESDDIMESNPSDSNTDKMDNTNETQVSTEDNSEKNTETDTKESNKEENTDGNDIEENSEKDKKPTKAKASTETKEKKKQETSKPTESEKATKEVKEQTKEETPSSDKKQTEPAKKEKPKETKVVKEEKPKETEPATKNKLEEITSQKETTKTEDTKTDGSYANQVLQLVNQERKNAGLSALTTNKNLTNAANKRAAETVKSFSHTRPNGSSFSTVFDEFNINPMAGGENIAYGQRTPEEVVNAWMNSSGHRANILNSNFNKLGVGVHKENGTIYWSQLFTD